MTKPSVRQDAPASPSAAGAPGTPLVLVVDDSATVRAYHEAILGDAGFAVEQAVNGYEALERAMATEYALLVVDVNMPVMNGYALVEAVRRQALRPDVPVIVVSTEAEVLDADQAYRAGANVYLVKPADPESLVLMAQMLTGQYAGAAPGDAGGSA